MLLCLDGGPFFFLWVLVFFDFFSALVVFAIDDTPSDVCFFFEWLWSFLDGYCGPTFGS